MLKLALKTDRCSCSFTASPSFGWGWRHQIGPFADTDYHVVVPDMRGYNTSEIPPDVSDYLLDTLTADVVALADSFGAAQFDLVAHD